MGNCFHFLKWLFNSRSVIMDNSIFRLHYRCTVLILVILGIVVLYCQYVGDPIDCTSLEPWSLMDAYCWMHSTYSVGEAWSKKVGVEVPYPGVDAHRPEDQKIYHNFYQWVGVVLLIQAIFFYIPHYLWKCLEPKNIKRMISDINNAMYNREERDANRNILADYLRCGFNRNIGYSRSYFFCELLNVINVIVQLCLFNKLSESSSFGTEVSRFIQQDWSVEDNPMIRVFPRLTKCTFYIFGRSGDVQKHDALCTLNINVLNEKIYIFLWFWFVILAIVSCMSVVCTAMLHFSSKIRLMVLVSRVSLVEKKYIEAVTMRSNVGEWFLLDLICRNLNPGNIRELVHELVQRGEFKNRNAVV